MRTLCKTRADQRLPGVSSQRLRVPMADRVAGNARLSGPIFWLLPVRRLGERSRTPPNWQTSMTA
jgi:hypothetical protein